MAMIRSGVLRKIWNCAVVKRVAPRPDRRSKCNRAASTGLSGPRAAGAAGRSPGHWDRALRDSRGPGGQDVEVAVENRDGLARQAAEPLDVIHRRLVFLRRLGVLEHDHVDAVRQCRRPRSGRCRTGISRPAPGRRCPTGRLVQRCGSPGPGASVSTQISLYRQFGQVQPTTGDRRPLLRVHLAGAVDRELVAAFRAGGPLLIAEQRLGHRPGRDDERLGDEGLEQQDQDDDEDDRLDDLAEGVLDAGGASVLSFGLAAAGRHTGAGGAGGRLAVGRGQRPERLGPGSWMRSCRAHAPPGIRGAAGSSPTC